MILSSGITSNCAIKNDNIIIWFVLLFDFVAFFPISWPHIFSDFLFFRFRSSANLTRIVGGGMPGTRSINCSMVFSRFFGKTAFVARSSIFAFPARSTGTTISGSHFGVTFLMDKISRVTKIVLSLFLLSSQFYRQGFFYLMSSMSAWGNDAPSAFLNIWGNFSFSDLNEK